MMMRRWAAMVVVSGMVTGSTGCAVDAGGEGVGESSHSVSTVNRLTLNRLTLNRLTLNGLAGVQLSLTRLSSTQLQLNDSGSGGLEDTAEGRETLNYVAICALPQGTSLVATDSQGTQYEFPGRLGLAPDWETRALTEAEQQLVSGCLLAHVNAYGMSVGLSLRAVGKLSVSKEEMDSYTVYEGSFFGDLFTGEGSIPKMYACQGDEEELAMVHSSTRSLRVCTDGLCADDTSGFEIVAVGRCHEICRTPNPKHGWRDCTVTHPDGTTEVYSETMSAFLYADNPDGANRTCGNYASCNFAAANGHAAIFHCGEEASCALTCGTDSMCIINEHWSRSIDVTVQSGATAQIDCKDTEQCAVRCATGSSCKTDCQGSLSCTAIECAPGADCMLDCTDTASGTCGFATCPTGAIDRGNNIWVCDGIAQ